jgi:hypothetical protein
VAEEDRNDRRFMRINLPPQQLLLQRESGILMLVRLGGLPGSSVVGRW